MNKDEDTMTTEDIVMVCLASIVISFFLLVVCPPFLPLFFLFLLGSNKDEGRFRWWELLIIGLSFIAMLIRMTWRDNKFLLGL